MSQNLIDPSWYPFIGTVAVAVINWLLNRKKTRAEVSKTDAESNKIITDTANIAVSTSKEVIVTLNERITKLEQNEVIHDKREAVLIKYVRKLIVQIEGMRVTPVITQEKLDEELAAIK